MLLTLPIIYVASAAAQDDRLAIGGGNFVSATRTGTMTVAQVNGQIKKIFGDSVSPTVQALDLYKVSYRSRDEKNRPVVLTGLVVLPRGGTPNSASRALI